MRKGKSIIGLKVITQSDGVKLGSVRDLIFDDAGDSVLALLLSEKDLFGLIDAQIVPWEQIQSIGRDAVVVQSSASKIKAGDDERVRGVMNRNTSLSGTRIYTTDGQNLGTLADMFFDETSGRVEGYEISGGFVADTMSGKQFLPAQCTISLGIDVAFVAPEVADELEAKRQNEPHGLHGTASTVAAKVSESLGAAKEKVSDAYTNVAHASVEKQREFVIGKVAAHDVVLPADNAVSSNMTPVTSDTPADVAEAALAVPTTVPAQDIGSDGAVVDGQTLVRKGETITAYHADRAIAASILGQLLLAATGGAASDVYTTGREKLSSAAATGGTQAGGVGADLQARAEQAIIGKPAAREVTAPDGFVIAAPGTIVTTEILELARVNGKERELVASAGLGAASQSAQSIKESTVEGATHLWGTLKHKAEELAQTVQAKRDERDAEYERKAINNALGRPVTRVILDRSDHVVLNLGELITHAAIDRARAAGVLHVLLDSVYIADPNITPDMARAPEAGEASLLPRQNEAQSAPVEPIGVEAEARSEMYSEKS